MEHPSQKWLNKFSETLVPETFIKIFYDSTEPGVQKDASASADSQTLFSNVSGITSENDKRSIAKYATGELNLHLLDGTFLLSPAPGSSANDAGYISRDIVSESNHPKLTFTFSRLHTRPIPGITILWSETLNEYAKSFKLTAYSGDTQVSTITVNDNNDVRAEVDWEISGYDKITLEVLSWCLPDRRARIEWFMVGFRLAYTKNNLISYTHESNRDPISGQLSKDSISFSLDNSQQTWNPLNPQGMYRYLYERQLVTVSYGMDIDGTTEWINGGKFFMSEWSVPANGIEASFVARDALGFLMDSAYIGRKSGTLYDICIDALSRLPENTASYSISDELKDYTVDISKENNSSYKNSDILQMAANAAGMVLYQTREGEIRIERPTFFAGSSSEVYEIDPMNNYQWPEITFSPRLKDVSCSVNNTTRLYPSNSNVDGVTQSISNPLLNDSILEKGKNSMTEAYSILSTRKKASLEYRASPHIDALDHVKLNHSFGYASEMFVTNAKYTFNGCFKGTLEGYMLSDIASVSLDQSLFSLQYADSRILTARLTPASMDSPAIGWSASPANIVHLDVLTNIDGVSTCRVSYSHKGTATVTASAGNSSASCQVTAEAPYITLSQSSANLSWSQYNDVTATFHPTVSSAPSINWSTSSGAVRLQVLSNSGGVSTCRIWWNSKGSATVTASAFGESASLNISTQSSALSNLPDGTIVKIVENGAAVDFILAQHNYLSDHNGAGRTLFVRRYGFRKLRFNKVDANPNQKYWLYDTDSGENRWFYYWGRYNDFWNNYHYGEGYNEDKYFVVPSYNDGPAEITNWLNGDYKNLFSASVKNQMGQTVLQKKSGFTSQVSASVFLLTAKELGIGTKGYYAYPDNSSGALPTAKQILNSETSYCWTRSRLTDGSVDGLSGDDATRAENGVVCCSYRGSSASVWANNGDVFARPAFTLPANLEVDANGNLMI
jgi:hypothetical protein